MQSPVEGPEQEEEYPGGDKKDRPRVIQKSPETHGTEPKRKNGKEAPQEDEGGGGDDKNCFEAMVLGTPGWDDAYAGSHRQERPVLPEGQVCKAREKRRYRPQGKETAQEQEFYPGTGYHGCIGTDGGNKKNNQWPEMAGLCYCSGSPGQKTSACYYEQKGRNKYNMQPSALQGVHALFSILIV